jgi:hypothetical protein
MDTVIIPSYFSDMKIKMNITETPAGKNKVLSFVKDVFTVAKNKIVNFVKGFYRNVESVGVLTLAAFGTSALIGELPFLLTLPWWIEATMVIPVASVILVMILVTIGEKRAKKRMQNG